MGMKPARGERTCPSPRFWFFALQGRGCTLAYDHVLLFNEVRQSLRRKPFRLLRGLCQQLRVSKGTLEKAVSAAAGETFRSFREEIIVSHVLNSFASRPTRTIKQISRALGYKSARSFARAIRRMCGLPPKDLRFRLSQPLLNEYSRTAKVDVRQKRRASSRKTQSIPSSQK